MTDTPPDRLSTNPRSPHFDMEKLQRGVGIRFKDRVRTDIEEYCISEGWVRVAAGKSRDRHGQPLTIKLSGPVEAWYENPAEEDTESQTEVCGLRGGPLEPSLFAGAAAAVFGKISRKLKWTGETSSHGLSRST